MIRTNIIVVAYLAIAVTAATSASRYERPARSAALGAAEATAATIQIESAHADGRADAPAVLAVFADFKCQFCAQFAATAFPVLRNQYVHSGQLQIAYLHSPLPTMRPYSLEAAEVAECAAEQGVFWPVHDLFFKRSSDLDDRRAWDLAVEGGAQLDELRTCVASGRAVVRVADHAALGERFRILSTPTFIVGAREANGQIRVVGQLSGSNALPGIQSLINGVIKGR